MNLESVRRSVEGLTEDMEDFEKDHNEL